MNLFEHVRRFGFGTYRRVNVRFLSADPSPTPSHKPDAKRKGSYVSIAQQIYESFQQSKTFVAYYDRINPLLFKNRRIPPVNWYCLSDETAEILFHKIKSHLSPGRTIIEMNPGLGIITKKLLSVGPSRLFAFEPDPNFREILSPLASEHPELTIIPKQFLSIWKEDFKEKIYGDKRLTNVLPGIEPVAWKSDPPIQIIGAVSSTRFIQYMVSCVTFQQGVIAYGRLELFLITTPEILVQITYDRLSPYSALCMNKFTRFLLFSIYFDVELLCEVDEESFLPWFRNRKSRKRSAFVQNDASTRLVLIKAVLKKDLYDVVPHDQLKPLWFFLNQAALHPKFKVIPYLEKWIPGCGPMYIVKGLSVFTEFRDLTPSELLDVFLLFSNHPDYESCMFHEAVDVFVFKKDSDALDDPHDVEYQTSSTEDIVHDDSVQHGGADEKGV